MEEQKPKHLRPPQKLRKNNKTGVRGVSYQASSGRYRARISLGGEMLYIGIFSTIEEAAQAIEDAKERYNETLPSE